jgi:CO/xanthine dehydrogenase FAD-binding subunit
VDFLQPTTWQEALAIRAERPEALPISGGTDVMVDLNFDRRRPEAVLDLTRVPDLSEWAQVNGWLRVGAGVTYTRIIGELSNRLPGLAIASRTVGSPQIRNRGTVGGNLGTASPAGDALPPLLAAQAEVEVASIGGYRRIPMDAFCLGPKLSALRSDELIAAFWVRPASGPQQFAKVGTRNAMVIAVASFALELDPVRRRVGTGIGSAGPTPLVAGEAQDFLERVLSEDDRWTTRVKLPAGVAERFGVLVAGAAKPIDDVRGTADYRRHALRVMARRTLSWAWTDYRGEQP